MKTLIYLIVPILMAGNMVASPILHSSEAIEDQVQKSNLVLIGSLSEIDPIAFFDGLSLIGKTPEEAKKSRPKKTKVMAMYCAKLKSDRILHTAFQNKTLDELSVVWNGVFDFSGNQIDSLRYSFCPPVSVPAFQSNSRIWFLKVEHGFCYIVSDHSIENLPNILEFIKYGRSTKLDIENLESRLNSFDEDKDDPFYDKEYVDDLNAELKILRALQSATEKESKNMDKPVENK